ncbi:MAG: dienelactone hydrolase family protein [Clostridia bacterium]|nr:dienelactone hydrolase family protein [Clostridia bacterium]
MKYTESLETSAQYKQSYADGIDSLIQRLEMQSREKRTEYIADILQNKDRYRQDFVKMLGWPLTERGGEDIPRAVSQRLSQEEGYDIYRLQIEVTDGLMLTGLLFKYTDGVNRPLVVVQHGGSGTPELISGINGSTANYNNMLRRVFDRGVNVFAPQLLLWSAEKYKVDYDRQKTDARLRRLGGSITALEVYGIIRALDYLTTLPEVGKIGMVGMSYGGFYTMMTAAADVRIQAALTCSYFCDGSLFTQTDLCHYNEGKYFGQAETACLVHPRKLFIQMGDSDELFDFKKSEEEFLRIKELIKSDCGWVEFSVYGGNHEFCKDDTYIQKLTDYLYEG